MAQNHLQENIHFSAAASDTYFHKSYAFQLLIPDAQADN